MSLHPQLTSSTCYRAPVIRSLKGSMPQRILISVTEKAGIEKFKTLADIGWEIISTGGTAKTLEAAGIACTPIETVTGFPEMMNGRLKTLHPNIFGGILADRSKPEHMQVIADHGIFPIDVVVVNLYAFDKKPGIENIDIGGPSLIRAAAKNGSSVTVVVDPADYDAVIKQIVEQGNTDIRLREILAAKVFVHTGLYDLAIHKWMQEQPMGSVLTSASAAAH